MQISDLDEDDLGGLDYRPRETTAPLPNIEAEGSQALSAKKRKAAPATATSAGKKKKTKTSSSQSTKDLEKEKAKTLRQTKLSFNKGDDSSSALDNIVLLDRYIPYSNFIFVDLLIFAALH